MNSVANFSQRLKTFLLPLVSVALLSSCELIDHSFTQSSSQQPVHDSQYWLDKIDHTLEIHAKNSARLQAIEQLVYEQNFAKAQEIQASLAGARLDKQQYFLYQLLDAELLSSSGRAIEAQQRLQSIDRTLLDVPSLKKFYDVAAKVSFNDHNIEDGLRAQITKEPLLLDHEIADHIKKMWAVLSSLDPKELDALMPYVNETSLRGWVALAKGFWQVKEHVLTPTQMITKWRGEFSHHIANQSSLEQLIFTTSAPIPVIEENIALLLPLSGNTGSLGNIIRLGFNQALVGKNIKVQIYDTNASSIDAIVRAARQRGASAIVGPLLKARVDALHHSDLRGLKVLALNQPESTPFVQGVCYLALSPEQETISAAKKMQKDGILRPLVLAPRSDFGRRSAKAFAKQWFDDTNSEVTTHYYGDPALLGAELADMPEIGEYALYFITTTASELRSAKNSLHNNETTATLKIYTSSRSYSSNNTPDFNAAMQGVKFSEIPLLAYSFDPLYGIAQDKAKGDFTQMRLFALGFDALGVMENFAALVHNRQYQLKGLTGLLHGGDHCVINRELEWLRYNRHKVEFDDPRQRAEQERLSRIVPSSPHEQEVTEQLPVDLFDSFAGDDAP